MGLTTGHTALTSRMFKLGLT